MHRLLLLSLVLSTATAAQTRYTWSGITAAWTDPAAWSPAGIPAAADTVVIGSGVAVLTGPTTVAGLYLPALGAISGDHDLTITAVLRWSGGGAGFTAFRGTGTVTVGPDATLLMDGPGATMRYGVTPGRTFVSQGEAVWTGVGRWADTGRFVNEGTLTFPQSYTEPVMLCFSPESPAVTNAAGGLVRRTGGGTVYFSCGFDNHGTVRVEQGTFELRGFNATGGADTGAYEVESGARLVFGGGTRTIGSSGSVTGDGTVEIVNNSNAHALTIGGTYDVPTTRLLGPAFPRLALDADATLPVFEMTGGAFGGSGTVTVTDAFTWSGGQMEGTGTTVLGPAATVSLSGPTLRLHDARTLRLEGAATWPGGTTITNATEQARLVNAGVLTFAGEGSRGVTNGMLVNEGEIVHAAGTTVINAPSASSGVVRVAGGVLRLLGRNGVGGTDTGRYALDGAGGRLEFAGGARTLAPGAVVDGIGTVAHVGGTLTTAADWRPGASTGVLRFESPASVPFRVGAGGLDIEIGGPVPGVDHDQLAVQTDAVLGGTLRVRLVGGFVPAVGDRFDILTCGGVCSGTFAALDLPPGLDGDVEVTPGAATFVVGTVVAADDAPLPTALALHAPAPNPVRAVATLRLDLPAAAEVRVCVVDALGREVAVVLDGVRPAGRHTVLLDAARLAPGVYVVRLVAPGGVHARRLTVAR